MFRRSQAALEFLTTYGWAFLVILIMISSLAYFGILNPSKLLPDRCNFGSEISCVDFSIDYGDVSGIAGTFNLRLKNSVGEPIVIDDPGGVSLALSSDAFDPFSCNFVSIDTDTTGVPYPWSTGKTIDIRWDTCGTADSGLAEGEKTKVSVTITYHLAKSSTLYPHEIAGEVFSTVT